MYRLGVPARWAGGDNHEIAAAGLAVDVDLDDVVGLEFGERGADGFEQGVGRRRWIGKAGLDDLRGIGQVGLALGPVRRSIIGEVWRPARDPRPRSGIDGGSGCSRPTPDRKSTRLKSSH